MAVIIGTDESLKGDSFGGIVVAGVKADDEVRKKLEDLGVRDSKKLTDLKIKYFAQELKKVAKFYCVNMFPEEYNEEISKYGLTGVMNKLHQKCINALKTGDEHVVVDKYPGCKINDAECIIKAEDEYVEVAAASIVARAEALNQMQELSILAGFTLPLGSSNVFNALIKMRDKRVDFNMFAKTSFRNVREIMNTAKLETLKTTKDL